MDREHKGLPAHTALQAAQPHRLEWIRQGETSGATAPPIPAAGGRLISEERENPASRHLRCREPRRRASRGLFLGRRLRGCEPRAASPSPLRGATPEGAAALPSHSSEDQERARGRVAWRQGGRRSAAHGRARGSAWRPGLGCGVARCRRHGRGAATAWSGSGRA